MTRIHTSEPQKQDPGSQSGVGWMQPLLLGIIGLSLFLLLFPSAWLRSSADERGEVVSRQAPEGAKALTRPRQTPPLGHTDSRLALWQPLPDPTPRDVWTAGKQAAPPAQPPEPVQRSWQLDALVAQVKSSRVITAEGAKEIKRLLRELRKQGAEAVPAIRSFLRQKDDVAFDKISGGELVGHHTLRLALFDTLGQIGGNEATVVSLEQLYGNLDPAEVFMLAQSLEKGAPGEYREEIVQAASNALQFLIGSKEQQGQVRPLFELLRDYGGVEAVANLEQFTANANALQYLRNKNTSIHPTVRVYALMALAGLPDGEGIPSLVALVDDPYVPVENKPELPFQILAQSSMDHDDAGEALVDLARAGKIPDRAWNGMGEALAGRYLQFPSDLSGGTLLAGNEIERSGIESPFLRGYFDDERNIQYEQRLVSADWSAEQVEQQIALLDKLLKATSRPAAIKALQQARESLQGGSRLPAN